MGYLDQLTYTIVVTNNSTDVFTILPDECGVYGISLSISCEGCVGPTECTFELKIDETEAPSVTDCPDNKEVTGCAATAIAGVTALPLSTAKDPAPITLGQFQAEGGDATDNCGIASISYQDVVFGACPILVTRTFYIDDKCGNQNSTCVQVFTVNPPAVSISCPANESTGTCLTQDAVNTAFDTWLAKFKAEGGCNVVGNFQTTPQAPSACGGSTSVTFIASYDCEQQQSCTRTFTVPNRPDLVVSGPADVTKGTCEKPADFAAWKAQFAVSGGCGTVVKYHVNDAEVTQAVFNNTAAPSKCGGSVKLKISAGDDCSQSGSKEATYAVPVAPKPGISCPDDKTIDPCLTQEEVNKAFADWQALFQVSNDCPGTTGRFDGEPKAPDKCGGTTEVTCRAIDGSGCYADMTCTKTFTVPPQPAIELSCPAPLVLECGDKDTKAKIEAWLESVVVTKGCNVKLTNDYEEGSLSDGCGLTGSQTVTFSAADDCGSTKSCTSQVIIEDTTAPTCDAPPTYDGITVFCGARFEVPDLVPLVTAGDLCSAPEEITVTQSPAAGTFVLMPLDGQVITFTVTDGTPQPQRRFLLPRGPPRRPAGNEAVRSTGTVIPRIGQIAPGASDSALQPPTACHVVGRFFSNGSFFLANRSFAMGRQSHALHLEKGKPIHPWHHYAKICSRSRPCSLPLVI